MDQVWIVSLLVAAFVVLGLILLYRHGFLPKMTDDRESDKKFLEYSQKFLFQHMRAAGLSNEEIEKTITEVLIDDPEEVDYWINLYLDGLPEDEREAAKKRLGLTV
jgi:hypothetical protein